MHNPKPLPRLSIVVPCYNERRNIPLILKRFAEVIPNRDAELILINNGSTDSSQKIIELELNAEERQVFDTGVQSVKSAISGIQI